VRGGHGRDDREPEAGAGVPAPPPGRVAAVEAFEDLSCFVGTEPRTVVCHLHDRGGAGRQEACLGCGSRWGVGTHVRQQVGEQLSKPVLVPEHHRRPLDLRGDGSIRLDRPCIGHGVRDHPVEAHGVALERATLVQPGQQQEVFDQGAHAQRLALDPAHREREVFRPLGRSSAKQLRVPPDGRQRRAQLVARVRDETPESVLGGLLGGESPLDAGDHVVEGLAEPPDFGGLVHPFDPS
jgi:hypothetical protein